MNKVILNNIGEIKKLCLAFNIKSLYAFGSVCTDKFNENSDIDLLATFNHMEYGSYADNYFEAVERFEKIFNRRVDLLTDKSLSNPYFLDELNKTKVYIYG